MKNIGQLLRISIYCYDLSTKFITLTAICHISESSVINLINILENPILHYPVTNLVSQPPLDHLAQGTRTEDKHQVVHDAGPRQDDQEDQPEPDEHKDLLIDRVYWQHAESIVGLYCF